MKNQRGFLMIVVAVMLIIITSLGVALVNMFVSGSKSVTASAVSHQAFDLAEAGLEDGANQLLTASASLCPVNTWGAWSVVANGDSGGQYQYRCMQTLPSVDPTTLGSITSTATTITVNDARGLAPFGIVSIGSEDIYYDGVTTAGCPASIATSTCALNNVIRGRNQTTVAASIPTASVVAQNQYTLQSTGALPTIANPIASQTLSQAFSMPKTGGYFATGTSNNSGTILRYAGGQWSVSASGKSSNFYGITFPSATVGLAVNSINKGNSPNSFGALYTYTAATAAWGALSTNNLKQIFFNDVSCLSTSSCYLVGSNLATGGGELIYHYNGASLTNVSLLSTVSAQLKGIDCSDSNTCMAVGSGGLVYQYLGGWTKPITGVLPTTVLNDVSCPSNGLCYLVGNNGVIYQYVAGVFSTMISGVAVNLNSVSCPASVNWCMAVGNSGKILNFNGSAWTSSATIPGAPNLSAVYCYSQTDCMAVSSNNSSTAYFFNGTNWVTSNLGANYILNNISGVKGLASSSGGTSKATAGPWKNQ